MKTIIVALLLFFSAASNAKPLKFEFDTVDDKQVINTDISEMVYIGETMKWILVARWEPSTNSNFVIMHSVTQYREVQPTEINSVSYERIFSYGFINCQEGVLHLLNEFYTDKDNVIQLANSFNQYEYLVNLNANVILQTLLIYTCRSDST